MPSLADEGCFSIQMVIFLPCRRRYWRGKLVNLSWMAKSKKTFCFWIGGSRYGFWVAIPLYTSWSPVVNFPVTCTLQFSKPAFSRHGATTVTSVRKFFKEAEWIKCKPSWRRYPSRICENLRFGDNQYQKTSQEPFHKAVEGSFYLRKLSTSRKCPAPTWCRYLKICDILNVSVYWKIPKKKKCSIVATPQVRGALLPPQECWGVPECNLQ